MLYARKISACCLTWSISSFYDGQDAPIVHIDFTQPYDEALRQLLLTAATRAGVQVGDGANGHVITTLQNESETQGAQPAHLAAGQRVLLQWSEQHMVALDA